MPVLGMLFKILTMAFRTHLPSDISRFTRFAGTRIAGIHVAVSGIVNGGCSRRGRLGRVIRSSRSERDQAKQGDRHKHGNQLWCTYGEIQFPTPKQE